MLKKEFCDNMFIKLEYFIKYTFKLYNLILKIKLLLLYLLTIIVICFHQIEKSKKKFDYFNIVKI